MVRPARPANIRNKQTLIKSTMKKQITLLFLICSIAVQAQLKLEDLSDENDIGLLQRIDLNIVSLVPTVDEYKNFKEIIKNLPLDYIKYVDSVDYSKFNKELSVIQIYSQNRVYRSKNSYEIKKNQNNDSLLVSHIQLDMKMKDYIIDYEEYNNLKVEYDIIEKIVKAETKINRIIFSKPGI